MKLILNYGSRENWDTFNNATRRNNNYSRSIKIFFKFLSLILILFFSFLSTSFSAKDIKDFEKIDLSKDQKPGRFFEDQPDVTDDYQIHFNYLISSDGEDREWDINGKMEKILLKVNKVMAKATAANKKGDGVARKYKFDYRKDGKLDITFVRLDMKKRPS